MSDEKLVCPHCNRTLRLGQRFRGNTLLKCPGCRGQFRTPPDDRGSSAALSASSLDWETATKTRRRRRLRGDDVEEKSSSGDAGKIVLWVLAGAVSLAVIIFGIIMVTKHVHLSDDGAAEMANLPEWSAKFSDVSDLAPEVLIGDYFAVRLPKPFMRQSTEDGKEVDGRRFHSEVWTMDGAEGRRPWFIIVGDTETPSGDPKSMLKVGLTAAIVRTQSLLTEAWVLPQSWDYGKTNKLLALRAEVVAGKAAADRRAGVMYAFYTSKRIAYCVVYYSDEEESKALRDQTRSALLTIRKR